METYGPATPYLVEWAFRFKYNQLHYGYDYSDPDLQPPEANMLTFSSYEMADAAFGLPLTESEIELLIALIGTFWVNMQRDRDASWTYAASTLKNAFSDLGVTIGNNTSSWYNSEDKWYGGNSDSSGFLADWAAALD